MKPRYLVGNWKLYVSARRSGVVARELARRVPSVRTVTRVVCPPATDLQSVRAALRGSGILLGAQDASTSEKSAATGSIAPRDLKDLGCRFVIVGHSERRAAGETDAIVARKLRAIYLAGMTSILCVGETSSARRSKHQNPFVTTQLRRALKASHGKIFIAYEPVWAISRAGKSARGCSPLDASAMLQHIRRTLHQLHLTTQAILYGGSVTSKNIRSYIDVGFDGALVGFASTKAAEYARMVKAIA